MAKTPVVIIHSGAGASLGNFYEQILADLDRRFMPSGTHNYYPELSESDHGQHASGSAHAAHAGDGLIIQGNYASTDGGKSWVHVERLIR